MTLAGGAIPGELAQAFARIGLENIQREFPNKLDHVMNDADDVRAPRALHPVFYGSYDWHSSVHMHWLLARLLRSDALPRAQVQAIAAVLDRHFTKQNVAAELAYLSAPSRQSFERTYGWAWLLKLHMELGQLAQERPACAHWYNTLQPLADSFALRYLQFLPLAPYPIRAGTHANSAFGLYFALAYARAVCHVDLENLTRERALAWFANDQRYPAHYEPSGDDFLSGGLMEAALMARVLDHEFEDWWGDFRPDDDALHAWLKPVSASDRRDPKLAHLDGLNLSRAWCWRALLPHLPPVQRGLAQNAADTHFHAALNHALAGDYVGTHWLASFALLALTEE